MEFRNVNVKGVNYPKTQLGKSKMDKLCVVATELFAKQNFYETSINDICKEAKTAVGTFYIYFADKATLYNFLVFNYKLDILEHLNSAITEANCSSRKEKERVGIKAFIRYVYERPYVYSIIWGSLSVDKKAFIDYYKSFAESYSYGLKHDENDLKECNHQVLSYVLMGITNFIGLKLMFDGDKSENKLDATVDEVIRMLEHGIFK